MAVEELNDILRAGTVDDIVVADNIGYIKANVPEADGMFLKVVNGITALHRFPDQDIHWIDTDTTSVPLNGTPNEVLSTTINQDMLPEDGSYIISGQLSNSRNQDLTVTIDVKDDGVIVGTQDVPIAADQAGKLFAFSGAINNTIASGSVVTVEFSASFNGVVTLDGNLVATKMDLTKAQAAPVTALTADNLRERDFQLNILYDGNLGNTLTRLEIEFALEDAGLPLPTDSVSFRLLDSSGHIFAVSYIHEVDAYVYERLSIAT